MQRELSLGNGALRRGGLVALGPIGHGGSTLGRLASARELSQRAGRHQRAAPSSEETAALWQVNAALREAEFGNAMAARHNAMAQRSRWRRGRDVTTMAALALVRAGDVAQAQRLVNGLDQDFPQNTIVQVYWLPAIRAAIELAAKNSAKALELLKTAAPYELGQSQPFFVGMMYPAYLSRAGLPSRAERQGSRGRVPENHQSPWHRSQLPARRGGPPWTGRAPTRLKVIPRMPVWPTKTSSSSGRAPIPTSLSSGQARTRTGRLQ